MAITNKMSVEAAQNLVRWFEKNKRDFPWRRDPSPYKVWIAEIMSQQTVMAALLPYFERFLNRFPHVQTLAAATEDDVLKHWAGLGYYSRARNVHKAAKQIVEGETSHFPQTFEGWLELPGVGPYTAAAVVSQCFDVAEPVWDGNVLRVASRFWTRADAYSLGFRSEAVAELREVLQRSDVRPSSFNQGLMELGALVCTPQNPKCELCPLSTGCGAYKRKEVTKFPPPKPRKAVEEFGPRVWVFVKGEGVSTETWLEPRTRSSWFGGLWDFPSELGGKAQPLRARDLSWDPDAPLNVLSTVKHQVTHHRFLLRPHVVQLAKRHLKSINLLHEGRWFKVADLIDEPPVPLSTTARKVLRQFLKAQACKNSTLGGSKT